MPVPGKEGVEGERKRLVLARGVREGEGEEGKCD